MRLRLPPIQTSFGPEPQMLTNRSDSVAVAMTSHAARARLPVDELLLAHRTVLLESMITDDVANETIAKLLFLRSQGQGLIHLYIDSPGGYVASSLAIRDMVDEMRPQVATHSLRQTAGTALVILAHGAPGRRSAAPGATLMLTPIDASRLATTDDIVRTRSIVQQMLAEDTGQTQAQLAQDSAASRRFSANEARDYGFIDTIAD